MNRHALTIMTVTDLMMVMFLGPCAAQNDNGPAVDNPGLSGLTTVEASMIASFPLTSNYYETSTYTTLSGVGEVLTSRQTVHRKPSISASVSARHRIYGTPIGSTGWNLGLELGGTFRLLRWSSDETSYGYCPNCFAPTMPESWNYKRKAFQMAFLIDNLLVLSRMAKQISLDLGINIQTGYTFWGQDNMFGTKTQSGITREFSETYTGFTQPDLRQKGNWLALNHSVRFLIRLAPTALRGVYVSSEIPLHQSLVDGTGGLYSYSFSFSIGYRIQK